MPDQKPTLEYGRPRPKQISARKAMVYLLVILLAGAILAAVAIFVVDHLVHD